MTDINPDLTIDISGNTASIATDYLYVNGISASASHVQIMKMMWGSSGESYRVSQSTPLPINIYSSNPSTILGISGSVSGTVNVQNTGTGSSFVYVKGSTGYQLPVTATIQGITNAIPVGITGTVSVAQPIIVVGPNSSGNTIYPIEVTGGRSLSSTRDTVGVTGTITITGGRYLNSVTDTVSVLGSDLGSKVLTRMYDSSGATLNSTSNALNVYLTNSGFTATINVGASTAIYNYATGGSMQYLAVAGSTAGAAVVVKGENAGAIEVTATSPLDVNVTNDLVINDTAIVEALTLTNNPLISTLTDIETNTSTITSIRSDITSGNIKTKITEITRPSRIINGTKTVSTGVSPLEVNTVIKVGVTVKAKSSNTDVVYVGGSMLLTSNLGYPLEPGESLYLECSNLNSIYCVVSQGTQQLSYIAS